MAIPTYTVGQVIGAADVNNWFVPVVAVKTADQSVTSSTTLVGDLTLFVPLAASATYRVMCYLNYEGAAGGTGDLKWTWTGPTSYTFRYFAAYVDASSGVNVLGTHVGADVLAARTAGAGNKQGVLINGTVVTSTTAGSLALDWAQNTSNATATIVHAQSYLEAQRIA